MVHKYVLILYIIYLFVFISPVIADGSKAADKKLKPIGAGIIKEDDILELSWLIDHTITNNPSLKVIEKEAQAAEKRIRQASALEDPVFTAGITNFPLIDMSFRSAPMTMKQIQLSQKFPFPGKRRLRENIAALKSEAIYYKYFEKQRELVNNVKQAYYELAYIEEAIEITRKNLELLSHLIKITQIKYEVGKGIRQDILKAQIEYSKINEELIFLEQKHDNYRNKLIYLAYLPDDFKPGRTVKLTSDFTIPDKDLLISLAFDSRPLIMQYEKNIEKAKEELRLAQKAILPDFQLSGSYGQRDNSYADLFSVNISFNLPIYKNRKQDEGVLEKEFQILSQNAELDSLKNEIRFYITDQLINI